MSKTAEEIATETAAALEAAAAIEAAKGEGAEAGETPAGGAEGETPPGNDAGTGAAAEDEVVVTIGDEAPPSQEDEEAKAPEWVRELRKSNRELVRKNKELERQAAERAAPADDAAAPGPKPKLADFEFDADKYEEALDKWKAKKQAADNASAERQAAERRGQEAWAARLGEYGDMKGKLGVKDYAESEAAATEQLSQTQQAIIIQGSANPALVIYALGKNPAKLKEFAAITDPVKFAFAAAKLEKDLKVTTRKSPPPPEKVVTGTAPKSGVVDSTLERLRAEAEKSGDYSKVTAHQRQKRTAAS